MHVFHYMSKIENNTLFFFFGILAAVGALHFVGFLNYAVSLYDKFGATTVNIGVGFLSAIVDNVPRNVCRTKSKSYDGRRCGREA